MEEFKTTNNLPFKSAPWEYNTIGANLWMRYNIGTCHGLWRFFENSYEILVVDNLEPGNGHLQDVFDWFENSCRRDKASLKIIEIWNERFMEHLVEKRGFVTIDDDKVEKTFFCACKIPKKRMKNSENGIHSYCEKCLKECN